MTPANPAASKPTTLNTPPPRRRMRPARPPYSPRRHGLRSRISRRVLSARKLHPAHRADHAAHDPQLHRREGARPAALLLTLSTTGTGEKPPENDSKPSRP